MIKINKKLQQMNIDQQLMVRAEQIHLLYETTPITSIIVFINASLLMAVLWDVIDRIVLSTWFFTIVAITVLRGLLYLAYKDCRPGIGELGSWNSFFLGGVITAALAWGATGIWLFSEDIVYQAFLTFVLAGMCAGAVSTLSFMRWPIISFLIISLSPSITQLFLSGVFLATIMGVMAILFIMGLMVTSKNIYNSTLENIVLRMESVEQHEILNQAYQDLALSRQESEKANHAKSEFLSRMSHELRTPMNAIIGFSQLMLMESKPALNEEQKDNVNEISVASKHLLYLINDVLDLATIESGKLQVSMEPVFLKDIIDTCLKLVKSDADKKEIKMIDQVSKHDYVVQADFTRLKQVLLNLLTNAVKYNCDQGVITVTCEKVDNARLRIAVTDTGRGLTDKEVAKLFVPFERLQGNEGIEGTGIGLVITRQLVELMSGEIGVDSVIGKGSTFWVELDQVK